MGVPLHIWQEEAFKKTANNWGKTLNTSNCDLKKSSNLIWGKVLISTSLRPKINEIRSIKVGDLFYAINVDEEDGCGIEP